jgi:ATP-dependent Clp protease ATP-binding subunit ClpA
MKPSLTPETKRLFQRAASVSAELGHHYLGVEHVILAVLSLDEAAGMQALESADLPAKVFVQQLCDEIVRYPQLPPRNAGILITPRLARVIETGRAESPLDPARLFRGIVSSHHSLPMRVTIALGGNPTRLAEALAGLVRAAPPAKPSAPSGLLDTMSIAMRGRRMLDDLVEELGDRGYNLQLDNAIVGWMLLRELDSASDSDTLNRIFAEDIRPRLEAAMVAHPPGSAFCLTLGGDRIDLLIVKGKPEA